jgi:hypothetical protein
MDTHYIVPDEDVLRQAMNLYTQCIDDQIQATLKSVDHSVDQGEIASGNISDRALATYSLEGIVLRKYCNLKSKKGKNYKALNLLVPPARIELAAHGLGIHCSIH